MLYEVGDPAAYITPDVVADFTSVRLSEVAADVVQVENTRGLPATDSYKVSIAYRDGFSASGTLVIFGPDAVAKARACGQMILRRVERAGYVLEHTNVECLGTVDRFAKELAPLVTSGPPGITGYTTGRPPVREVFAYWPALILKSAVEPVVLGP